MRLPKDRSEVTEDWVADVCSSFLDSPGDPIEAVRLTNLGDGVGQLSELLLADVDCRGGSSHQFVIKLHTNVPEMHQIGMGYRYYETEVRFYTEFASQVPMKTPAVYLAEFDPDEERVLLVMESLGGWHTPDQVEGASLDEIRTATAALAGLTAAFWNEPLLKQHRWMKNARDDVFSGVPEMYRGCIETAVGRFGQAAPVATLTMAEKLGQAQEAILDAQVSGTQVLSHWDYRVANFFYGPQDEFVVIDWQMMMMTPPAADLSYLLGTNIETELRRSAEAELLEIYLDGLHEHGISDYTMNDLERDYRWGMLFASGIPIIGGAGVDESNPDSLALIQKMGSRLFNAIEDWDSLALLS